MLPHEPCSLDMSPVDFVLFPKLRELLPGRRFSSLEEVSAEGTRTIRHMNKSGVGWNNNASKTLRLGHREALRLY